MSEGRQERGVDISLALDLVQATYEHRHETAVIVSQDWDFGPAVRLAETIAKQQRRRLVFESAFPVEVGQAAGRPGVEHRGRAMCVGYLRNYEREG